jgi:predicted HNH restriction endonuclease
VIGRTSPSAYRSRGIVARNISKHLKRYLIEHYGEACSQCGWHLKHPVSDRVPLEIDHIDGDAENNQENNLRLICPNCHSLTPNFRNLNKGKGRTWRSLKYIKNK